MLIPKLLRINEATVQEIEELAEKLSEKEYTSFSALVRILIRRGLDNMGKSIINSERVKKTVHEVMDKVLEDCAFQQEANGKPYEGFDYSALNEKELPTSKGLVEPNSEMKEFSETKPTKIKITVEFYFGEGKRSQLFCQPTIDLTNIK